MRLPRALEFPLVKSFINLHIYANLFLSFIKFCADLVSLSISSFEQKEKDLQLQVQQQEIFNLNCWINIWFLVDDYSLPLKEIKCNFITKHNLVITKSLINFK